MFVGRKQELESLNSSYQEKIGRLIVIYGRRRIGKSELIHHFLQNKNYLYIDGLENERTPAQIRNFVNQLAIQTAKPHLLNTQFKDWFSLFNYLTENVFSSKNKYVLALDELQWMAAGQSKLVHQIKSFWDQHWRKQGVLLILCGSIAHYMIKNVVKSKALYGRIDQQIHLKEMSLSEIHQFLPNKSPQEILRYMLVFGGIPKYYDILKKNISFEKNINKLCFCKDGFFVDEVDKIFYSQFKEHLTYKKIAELLVSKNYTLEEIAKKIKYSSGGSLKGYLDHLEMAGFCRRYQDIFTESRKGQRYKLVDPFLRFYYSQMTPNLNLIMHNQERDLYNQLIKPKINPAMGFAFENFCMNNAETIAQLIGIENLVTAYGSHLSKEAQVQFDLIYIRSDSTLSVCEIKYYNEPVSTQVIREMDRKLSKLIVPRGYSIEKVLITVNGADQPVKDSGFFDKIIKVEDFLHK